MIALRWVPAPVSHTSERSLLLTVPGSKALLEARSVRTAPTPEELLGLVLDPSWDAAVLRSDLEEPPVRFPDPDRAGLVRCETFSMLSRGGDAAVLALDRFEDGGVEPAWFWQEPMKVEQALLRRSLGMPPMTPPGSPGRLLAVLWFEYLLAEMNHPSTADVTLLDLSATLDPAFSLGTAVMQMLTTEDLPVELNLGQLAMLRDRVDEDAVLRLGMQVFDRITWEELGVLALDGAFEIGLAEQVRAGCDASLVGWFLLRERRPLEDLLEEIVFAGFPDVAFSMFARCRERGWTSLPLPALPPLPAAAGPCPCGGGEIFAVCHGPGVPDPF